MTWPAPCEPVRASAAVKLDIATKVLAQLRAENAQLRAENAQLLGELMTLRRTSSPTRAARLKDEPR